MASKIFVNLPVKDLTQSVTFFSALGFTFNPTFTDDNATCMIIGENIFAMLLTKPFFRTFTDKDLCDTATHTEVLVALSLDSRADVDAMVAKAKAAGGRVPRPPQDHGFMYGHGFEDLDGHIWEVFHMEPGAQPNA